MTEARLNIKHQKKAYYTHHQKKWLFDYIQRDIYVDPTLLFPAVLTQFSLLSYISLSHPCSPLVKFSLFFLFSSKKFWIPLLFFAILSLTHG